MASSFPTNVDSFTTKQDNVDNVLAAHVNDLQDAVVAAQTKIGVSGSTDESSLDHRIALKQTAFPGVDETTPVTISIDYTTRVLTLTPTGATFNVFTDGDGVTNKYVKTGAVNFPAFTDTNGIWYFSFDQSGNPVTSQTAPSSYRIYAPVYRILWNNTLSGSAKAITEAYEIHPNNIPGIDHDWKHQFGAVWKDGGILANTAIASGTPNASGINTCVGLTTLTNLDDNLQYTITNSTGGLAWQQDLGETTPANITVSNGALMPIRYQNASSVQFVLPATRFPFDFTGNVPNYITATGTRTAVDDGYFFVYFITSIQDSRNGTAVKLWSAPAEYANITAARAVNWSDIQAAYPVTQDHEVRPLYRMIFEYRAAYSTAVKGSALREVQDIRVAQVTATTSAGSIPAPSVTVVPAGNISSTNVQSALQELDTEKALLAGDLSQAFAAASLDVGNADTTITRSAAGVVAVEGVVIPTISSTNTITNKRNQKRVYSTTSLSTLTPEIDTYDVFCLTAQATALTIANHSTSTPANGEMILIRILDNGTARAISFGTNYVAKAGVALPTTTVASKNMCMLFIWDSNLSKYNLLSVGQEA